MRIEKINEHQIRCTLYQKDLKDREIRISELAYGTEKARALFRDMMQQASYEFGFEADDIPLMIEAIPMLPDALILLITKVEDPDELDTRFSNFTDDPSEHYLDDSSTDDFVIINDDEEFDADDFDIDGPDSAEDMNIEQMLNKVNSQTKWPGHGKADAVLDQLFHTTAHIIDHGGRLRRECFVIPAMCNRRPDASHHKLPCNGSDSRQKITQLSGHQTDHNVKDPVRRHRR